MSRFGIRACAAAAMAVTGFLSLTSKSHAEGDVWLHTDTANNKLTLGLVDEAGVTFTSGVRVFPTILVPDALPFSPFDSSATEPGFQAEPGDLPASQTFPLTVTSFSVWDGSALASVSGVSFGFDPAEPLESEADGHLHDHSPFGLTDLPGGGTAIPDGAYVASFYASTAGLLFIHKPPPATGRLAWHLRMTNLFWSYPKELGDGWLGR